MKHLSRSSCLALRTVFHSPGVKARPMSFFRASLAHRQQSSPRLFDNFADKEAWPAKPSSPVYWYQEVSSTMDTSRELVKSAKSGNLFTVVAERQTKGRGTRGRTWMFGRSNLLMTIAVRRSALPIPLHLLPLRVGTIVAAAMRPLVTDPSAAVQLKWPNDVLIDGKKVSGMLIEMEGDYLLIGIGCNVFTAPEVSTLGAEAGRSSTALYMHNKDMQRCRDELSERNTEVASASNGDSNEGFQTNEEVVIVPSDYHKQLGVRIVQCFERWLSIPGSDAAERVVADFSREMDFSEQRLRDVADPVKNRVRPLRVNADGTLQVRYLDGSEDCLVADYLW